ncbi:hypothetical protein ACFQX7_34025 [Luedemannella flava]
MRFLSATGDTRLQFWQRVREFAVPPSMIESATVRRCAGDWSGACAAAHVDVDLDLRATARTHGREFADDVRADLRRLAPDLLRWHLPRIAPDGLLRPGLTVSLASYPTDTGPVHLVVRTPPAWADAGQRISLALWDAARPTDGVGLHPHPRPDRRFRLDLHRHLWAADRSSELRERAGAGPGAGTTTGQPPPGGDRAASPLGGDRAAQPLGGDRAAQPLGGDRAAQPLGGDRAAQPLGDCAASPVGDDCAVDRWADEAAILLRSQGREAGTVAVRLSARRRLLLHVGDAGTRITAADAAARGHPDLPDAATWVLPDLALLRAGLIDAGKLHPLVAAALAPDHGREAGRGTRTGVRAWSSAVASGTGSGSWTAGSPRSTTTRSSCAGRRCWSRWADRRCRACARSTRRPGSRSPSTTSGAASTTATSPARSPSSRRCWARTRCSAAARCATSWRPRWSSASATASTGPA